MTLMLFRATTLTNERSRNFGLPATSTFSEKREGREINFVTRKALKRTILEALSSLELSFATETLC